MNILANLGVLSTPQAQQLQGLQQTQSLVQKTLAPSSSPKPSATPGATVDLSPAAQAVLNQKSQAAVDSLQGSGGYVVDAGNTGYDDGGFEAQQSDTSVEADL